MNVIAFDILVFFTVISCIQLNVMRPGPGNGEPLTCEIKRPLLFFLSLREHHCNTKETVQISQGLVHRVARYSLCS